MAGVTADIFQVVVYTSRGGVAAFCGRRKEVDRYLVDVELPTRIVVGGSLDHNARHANSLGFHTINDFARLLNSNRIEQMDHDLNSRAFLDIDGEKRAFALGFPAALPAEAAATGVSSYSSSQFFHDSELAVIACSVAYPRHSFGPWRKPDLAGVVQFFRRPKCGSYTRPRLFSLS